MNTLHDAADEHGRGADAAEHRSVARLGQVGDAQVRAAEHCRGAQRAALEPRPRLHHVDAAQLRLCTNSTGHYSTGEILVSLRV